MACFLLEVHNLAVVAGASFGLSPYIRISYAVADEKLDLALVALRAAAAELMED